eukprot:m.162158 g.162158  ORF g.162158 m.162158 type:complete len:498 (+) comp12152_c0_seq1:45-1538(+)
MIDGRLGGMEDDDNVSVKALYRNSHLASKVVSSPRLKPRRRFTNTGATSTSSAPRRHRDMLPGLSSPTTTKRTPSPHRKTTITGSDRHLASTASSASDRTPSPHRRSIGSPLRGGRRGDAGSPSPSPSHHGTTMSSSPRAPHRLPSLSSLAGAADDSEPGHPSPSMHRRSGADSDGGCDGGNVIKRRVGSPCNSSTSRGRRHSLGHISEPITIPSGTTRSSRTPVTHSPLMRQVSRSWDEADAALESESVESTPSGACSGGDGQAVPLRAPGIHRRKPLGAHAHASHRDSVFVHRKRAHTVSHTGPLLDEADTVADIGDVIEQDHGAAAVLPHPPHDHAAADNATAGKVVCFEQQACIVYPGSTRTSMLKKPTAATARSRRSNTHILGRGCLVTSTVRIESDTESVGGGAPTVPAINSVSRVESATASEDTAEDTQSAVTCRRRVLSEGSGLTAALAAGGFVLTHCDDPEDQQDPCEAALEARERALELRRELERHE